MRKWLIIVAVCSLMAGACGMYAALKWAGDSGKTAVQEGSDRQQQTGHAGQPDLQRVATAYELIKKSYVKKVNDEQLIQGAIQGMIGTLKDPYSAYMDAKASSQFSDSLGSSFEGIGAEITIEEGRLMIVAPFKHSPAEKAGLKPRDVIKRIDGQSAEGLDAYEASMKIRGRKGTVVQLEIIREGISKPLQFGVKREEIPIQTVSSSVKKKHGKPIGYIEITSFSRKTGKDFEEALEKLEKKNITGLIIDVRGNPGGLLDVVEDILKLVVTNEKPFVQIEERSGKVHAFFSERKEKKPYPIKVLIDEGSASASEILAGALKEAEGAELVGMKTFGKGTVQEAIQLEDGSNIKLTTFKWLTPNGNWIHQKGIEPTIEVKQPDYFSTHPLESDILLVRDMNSEQVKIAQEMLSGLGFGTGRMDGYFDEQTEKAVKAFQIQADLKATGEIDRKTAELLEQAIMKAVKDEKNDLQLQVTLSLFK